MQIKMLNQKYIHLLTDI